MGLPSEVNNLMLGGDAGYRIERSLRFRASVNANMARTPASAGNQTRWTFSFWYKPGNLADGHLWETRISDTNREALNFASRKLKWANHTVNIFTTTMVFRDPSAWYHIVFVYDSPNATSTERYRLYVNGVRVTAFDNISYPSLNQTSITNGATPIRLMCSNYGGTPSGTEDGYLAEFHFIDGQSLTPSSFGQTDPITGVWGPKKYAGIYGTNGYYLKFTDNSGATATTIGKDFSGNGNNWTPTNISVTAGTTYDSMLDSPTNYADGGNGRGNYCVLNPLTQGNSGCANGNLTLNFNSAGSTLSTVGVTSGKWYFETTVTTQVSDQQLVGLATPAFTVSNYVGQDAFSWGIIVQNNTSNGQSIHNGVVGTDYGNFTNGDVAMVAFDADAGRIWFGRNGTWFNSGDPAAGTGAIYTNVTTPVYPALTNKVNSGGVLNANFGQRPFAYTPPSGFKALNTQNLPQPSIVKGSDYFNALLYTGDGTNDRTISGFSFSPDMAWVKNRSAGSTDPVLSSVPVSPNSLFTSNTLAEAAGYIKSFGTNSIVVGNPAVVNGNTNAMVSWYWKEGATPGFDIVTYTGNGSSAGTAHNLGVRPNMVIYKRRSTAQDWGVIHSSLPDNGSNAYFLRLNTTTAQEVSTTTFPLSGWSSTQIPLGTNAFANGNGETYVAYVFAEVPGFSRFGSYTGNGSADGTFVWLGFRPAFFLVKASSGGTAGSQGWAIADSKRLGYNLNDYYLFANSSAAEGTGNNLDLVSNGVKMRGGPNENGTTYVYAAFAENPFKYARAR